MSDTQDHVATPPRTYRVLGIAVVAGGKAVDLALVETDGVAHVRHIETERQPLGTGPVLAAVIHVTRVFMGDRALQPFAIDGIGLAAETGNVTADAIAAGCEVETRVSPPDQTTRTGTRAERSAFVAVGAMLRDDRGCFPPTTRARRRSGRRPTTRRST